MHEKAGKVPTKNTKKEAEQYDRTHMMQS
jgi:hypothetical protein